LRASASIAPNLGSLQGEILPRRSGVRPPLRLVQPAPPPRPRRKIEVRVVAIAGLYPYGGVTRSFQMTHRALETLIETAERLEHRA
jgi:hypothetical protein